MFKNLDHKKRFYYLAGITILGLILIYTLAISTTREVKKQCKTLSRDIAKVEQAPQKLVLVQQRLENINNIMGDGLGDQIAKQELLVEKTGNYCKQNNMIIKEILPLHEYKQQDYIIETSRIIVKGKFNDLIKLLYKIEKSFNLGKVASVQFLKHKNLRTQRISLNMHLYIQNIKTAENED